MDYNKLDLIKSYGITNRVEVGDLDTWFDAKTVVPGALIPKLLEDNGPSGRFFQPKILNI